MAKRIGLSRASSSQQGTRISLNLNKSSTKPVGLDLQTSYPQLPDYNPPSSPIKGIKRSCNDDSPVLPQKRPRYRPEPSRRSSQKVSISSEGSPPKTVSKLFYGTTEFWLLILGERSWPFSFDPAPLETSKLEDITNQGPNAKSQRETDSHSQHTKETLAPRTTDSQNCWDEARLHLGEKRDQLCLWKVGFSDRDLDGLLESEVDIYRRLGRAILEALLRIAVSMSTAVDLQKICTGKNTPSLQESAQKLDKFIKEGSKTSSGSFCEHDPESSEMIPALVTSTKLLSTLQSDIDKLSKLSLQIKLATTDQK